ncbi:hypothetical protein CYMTET_30812 [Cymbomonas tetramitiformis]|uniref:U1-type domain-containing protein n=1 Tax=Cymbomonas tetramitiformis TaxID=36881 RepID=A0AAE0FIK8_9CHLO|nr:hypothetical protein CYMTET_30812 [Cymbomonas tetramitiformis]
MQFHCRPCNFEHQRYVVPGFPGPDCGDSLKKPKVAGHMRGCSASWFTCIDCQATFDRHSVQWHTQCVTEHEKYAQCATKPGGKLASASGNSAKNAATPNPLGDKFLATSAPWYCSCCRVSCTSSETLAGHAEGKKHRNKVKAALAAEAAEQRAAPPSDEMILSDSAQKDDKVIEERTGGTAAKSEQIEDEAKSKKKRKAEAEVPHEGGKENKKKKRQSQEVEEGHKKDKAAPDGEGEVVKWMKLIKAELKSAEDHQLKVKKLSKLVLQQAIESTSRPKKSLRKEMEERLASSSKHFTIDNGVAKLN